MERKELLKRSHRAALDLASQVMMVAQNNNDKAFQASLSNQCGVVMALINQMSCYGITDMSQILSAQRGALQMKAESRSNIVSIKETKNLRD